MKSEELKKVIEGFEEQGKMALLEGVTTEQIEEFEQSNSVKLPAQFKEWLAFSDGGELFLPAGIQLYGVANKPIIDVNDDNRPDDNYIVIGALSNGDPILCEKAGEKVCIYNHEVGRIEEDEIYDDFDSFLNDLPNMLGIGG